MLSGGARDRGNTPEQLQQALRTELADVLCQVLLLARHHDESTCRLRSRRSGFVETLTGCSDRPRTRIASRFARGLAMSGTGTRERHPSIGGRARYRPITGHQSVSDPPMPHFDPSRCLAVGLEELLRHDQAVTLWRGRASQYCQPPCWRSIPGHGAVGLCRGDTGRVGDPRGGRAPDASTAMVVRRVVDRRLSSGAFR